MAEQEYDIECEGRLLLPDLIFRDAQDKLPP